MSKLFYGIGCNSMPSHETSAKGRYAIAYQTWKDMMKRCYCPKFQEKHPTYIGCTVADEWHDFQVFAEWFENHEYSDCGFHLDKDLLTSSKVYGSHSCCLIPQELNKVILFKRSNKGGFPHGVSFEKESCSYKAQLSVNGKRLTLGRFKCPSEAYQSYKTAKERHVRNKALEWANRIDWNVFVALMEWRLAE